MTIGTVYSYSVQAWIKKKEEEKKKKKRKEKKRKEENCALFSCRFATLSMLSDNIDILVGQGSARKRHGRLKERAKLTSNNKLLAHLLEPPSCFRSIGTHYRSSLIAKDHN